MHAILHAHCASSEDTCYGNICAPEAYRLSWLAWLSNGIGYVSVMFLVRDTCYGQGLTPHTIPATIAIPIPAIVLVLPMVCKSEQYCNTFILQDLYNNNVIKSSVTCFFIATKFNFLITLGVKRQLFSYNVFFHCKNQQKTNI